MQFQQDKESHCANADHREKPGTGEVALIRHRQEQARQRLLGTKLFHQTCRAAITIVLAELCEVSHKSSLLTFQFVYNKK